MWKPPMGNGRSYREIEASTGQSPCRLHGSLEGQRNSKIALDYHFAGKSRSERPRRLVGDEAYEEEGESPWEPWRNSY